MSRLSWMLVRCPAWATILVVLGCSSPEHQLLASARAGGSSLISTPGGNGGSPGTGGCSFGDCGQHHTCGSDRDCAQNPYSVCVGDECVGCEALPTTLPACPWDWIPVPIFRNGCPAAKCGPPPRCWSDADCPLGQKCYAGVDCPEYPRQLPPPPPGPDPGPGGGWPDPAMCQGNLCAAPGCIPQWELLDCMVVGCGHNFTCQSSCTFSGSSAACSCDPSTLSWVCNAGCGTSQCVPPS